MKDRHLYNRAVHALMRATVADACHASDYDVIEDLDIVGGGKRDEGES